MKKEPQKALFTFLGGLLFFVAVAFSVTVALLVYGALEQRGSDMVTIAIVLFIVVLFVTALYCTIDLIRRRKTVDKPMEDILAATERMSHGDFSARLSPSAHAQVELETIKRNVNLLAEELGKSAMLSSDFIANVSHELKTPLAVIQNYAAALQNPSLDESTKTEYARQLQKASARLSVLVQNILQLNKLENQKILPKTERFALHEHLAQAVIAWEERIESKNITLDCQFEELSVCSSPELLDIVWNNLLSNAVKFTPENGHIWVTLRAEGKNAVVSIKDDGCGISKQTGERIFDKFYQGDTSRKSEGNGLGLALVKRVATLIGAELSVQSTEGKGSAFSLLLKDVL